MVDTFSCPKCGRKLHRSREIAVEGVAFPVFQCDEWMSPREVEGEVFDPAFTSAVGKPFDRATGEGELPF